MAPKPSDDDLFIEPAEDEDVVYGDYNNTMDGASSSTRPYIRLTSQLRNVTRDSGAEVRMKCEAVGTLPISFTWLKNHAPIEKSRKVKVKHRESSSRLVLSDLEVLDSGYYQCIASNAAASVNSTSILRVNNVSGDKALKHRHKNKPQPAFNEDYEEDYEMDRGRLPDEEDADMYRVPDHAGGPGYAPAGASERWLDGVKIRVGDCVPYKGEACRSHLAGRHIMITSDNREDMYDIDRNLRAAMMFINSSPSISKECRSISQAVACYHMYKVCDSKQSNRIVSVCKRDCDRIEAEVCPSELALAAEHDLVGDGPRALLPKCASLPPQAASCIPVLETHAGPMVTPAGPSMPAAASHWCYVDSGQHYEGPVSITRTGKQCMQWSETTSREYNSDRYPQLRYAKNHCRNPGGKKTKPWCFSSPLGQEEYCDVPQCPSDLNMYPHLTEAPKINGGGGSGNESPIASLSSLWWSLAPSYQLALVCGGVGLSLLLLLLLCCACCCRGKKQQKGQRNHHHAPTSVGVHSANASVINSASNSAYYRKLNGTSTPILSRASGPAGHLEMAALLPNGMNNLGAPPPLYNDFRAAGVPIEPPFHIMEIPAQQLKQCEIIGEGQFGVIHSGLWSANMSGDPLQVAIKTVRVDASNAERASLEEEVKTVAAFDHPNVVSLLGVSYLDGARMAAVFDYQVHGDLVDFVRLRAPHGQMPDAAAVAADAEDFMRIATQIACGMEYLSSQRFTHRDLAARNCLVGDQRVIQIAHFGLTRPGYDHHYYKMLHRAWMPVRWMSKEAIEQGRFGEASDVWAFGVTLWELWSYGRTPYEGMSNQQVIQLIGSRNLLECPTACPTNIYSLMVECWHEHPERRPSFAELHSRLQAWQMASPAHSMLQQRAASSSGSSGRQQRQTTLPRGRRLEDSSPLMRRDANYAYSEDGDSD